MQSWSFRKKMHVKNRNCVSVVLSFCRSVIRSVCIISTAFIYGSIFMKVVSFDGFFPLVVPSRLRIFQGANHFPPTGENGSKWGEVWEKCIWQKIYYDKHYSMYRGYPMKKKNFEPPSPLFMEMYGAEPREVLHSRRCRQQYISNTNFEIFFSLTPQSLSWVFLDEYWNYEIFSS